MTQKSGSQDNGEPHKESSINALAGIEPATRSLGTD
ncbi:Uncharacterised protein [Lederbergia lenta]|uniref:Uncharacterized protein n=1 Tax=Lederbergia lenta TaxID=1467 RepID=A0A2X4W2B9_LEDLE|nr:Uncharacterised protein [Lederbergia lenta]